MTTAPPEPGLHPAVRAAGLVLLVALVHFACAMASLQLATIENTSPIWLPAGVDVALLVLLGRRGWAGVLAGDVLSSAVHGGVPFWVVCVQAAANALVAAGAATAILRWSGPDGPLRRMRDVLLLAVVVAPAAAVLSASAGVLALIAGAGLPADAAREAWRTWLTSDITGLLVVCPPLLVLASRPWRRPAPRRVLEALGILLALAAAFGLALARDADLSYVVFPVLVWAAMRFRLPGATATALVAAIAGVALAANGHGPFGVDAGLEALLHTQGFIAVSTLTALVIALACDEREAALAALGHRALHDPLTGLPNRDLLVQRLEAALPRAARDQTSLAVLMIDLDEFKAVNDSFGHHTGDELLCQIAPRLRAAARPQDVVARLGGDEFVVLCEGLSGPWDALDAARRLGGAWTEPFRLGDESVYVSGSTGIALARHGRAESGALLREADAAMYRAKAGGRGQAELYDEAMRARAFESLRLEGDLRRALAEGSIGVAFQPILDLRTGRPRGAEALARWVHPERGAVSPAVFIPVAEDSGLIAGLGTHVLRTACAELARWRATIPGAEDLTVSVNVSPRQIARGELFGDVKEILHETGLPPEALALELTESALMEETDAPGAVLATLRSLGVRIVLDDFGTGYSSLSYLRRFPLDGLKLDRAFVDGLALPDAAAVVRAIIAMGATLGLEVTAEGIETREHAERLRELGCPLGQGYMLARPLPAAEAAAVLADRLRTRAVAPREPRQHDRRRGARSWIRAVCGGGPGG